MWLISILSFGVYLLLMLFVLGYGLSQLHLLGQFWRHRQLLQPPAQVPTLPDEEAAYPLLCVQLPIYNEYYVVEELLAYICALDYPQARLEIQVLDDSTDETAPLLQHLCAQYRAQGLPIHYLHRQDRQGYKAGALAEGMKQSEAAFFLIFDADFRPAPNFIRQALPYLLADPGLALVQTRWTHLNREQSLFTRLQALALDTHFIIEQTARYGSGYFMHFNGTGGIWRRSAIEQAGGWASDTLTEDLDLSYRAQLLGWRLRFLPWVEAPSELPVALSAIKSQQYRWAKGPAECWRKNLGAVLGGSKLSLATRLHAFFHLSNSGVFLAVWLVSLLSLPLVMGFGGHYLASNWGYAILLFNLNSPLLFFLFFLAQRHLPKAKPYPLWRLIPDFFLFLAIFLGLGFHNGWAAWQGYRRQQTPFIRTPKFDALRRSWHENKYLRQDDRPKRPWPELGMAAYALLGLAAAWHWDYYGFYLFHLMLFLGYSLVALAQWRTR